IIFSSMIYFYNNVHKYFCQYITTILAHIAHNVPAVSDVFLRPIKETAQRFHGRKKMWRKKTAQRRVAPTAVFCSPAP
ncbi:MAG: hypothetical protein LBB83_11845, partial [Treponema sp.]|nr:hypothetical protein [Treponema sp.]